MVQKIALFNHKGGVSKTTTTFNLGWMLAEKGKTVILVDTDPQCNLTGMALGEGSEDDEERLEKIYQTHSNIKTGVAPAFESQPRAIEAVDCIPIESREGLFLLPGHVGLAEYEVTLGIAQELSGSIHILRNLPGAITDLLDKTAEKFKADYILIDMSPSLGPINQNILMTSDFFIIPTTADFFSVMAIDSLAKVLPKWYQWAKKASSLPILKEANYPFPDFTLKCLGIIVQNFKINRGRETRAFQTWIEKIERDVTDKFIPILRQNKMMLPDQVYKEQGMNSSLCLTKIPNFNSLIAISQEHGVPIYDLTPEQLGNGGRALDTDQKKQAEFKEIFSDLADKIITLTSLPHLFMQFALDQFNNSITRIRDLIALHNNLKVQVSNAVDLSDLLRSAIVLTVSAFKAVDKREVVKDNTSLFRGYALSIASLMLSKVFFAASFRL